jgi:hypothetical protein
MSADDDISVENLRTEYREVCENHRAISDFRAKLLTILPLASGTGIFLFLRKQSEPLDPAHLAAIGVFGFVVTFGLFLHELRGIMKCSGLIRRGKNLEERLKLRKVSSRWIMSITIPEATAELFGILTAVSELCATVRLLWLRAAGEKKDVDQ